MGVIDELTAKLRGAKRSADQARRSFGEVSVELEECRKELKKREARVDELERAISLLRNGLRTQTTSSGNVTSLKPR